MTPPASVELLAQLDSYDCPSCGASGQWGYSRAPARRLNAEIAAARCELCGHDIFLKRIVAATPSETLNQAIHEFAVAEEMFARFREGIGPRTARPLARMKTLLVFEFVPGDSPLISLKAGPLQTARTSMYLMGDWFSRLHLSAGERQGEIDLAEKLCSLEQRLASQGSPGEGADRAITFLRSGLADISNRHAPHRRLHCDAKPDNFLIHNGELTGIDIFGGFWNLPEYDLAQFLSQYEIAACTFFGHIEKQRQRELERSFLSAYEHLLPINQAVLGWLRVYFLLTLWLTSRGTSLLHRLRWDPLYRHRLECCLSELEAEQT